MVPRDPSYSRVVNLAYRTFSCHHGCFTRNFADFYFYCSSNKLKEKERLTYYLSHCRARECSKEREFAHLVAQYGLGTSHSF